MCLQEEKRKKRVRRERNVSRCTKAPKRKEIRKERESVSQEIQEAQETKESQGTQETNPMEKPAPPRVRSHQKSKEPRRHHEMGQRKNEGPRKRKACPSPIVDPRKTEEEKGNLSITSRLECIPSRAKKTSQKTTTTAHKKIPSPTVCALSVVLDSHREAETKTIKPRAREKPVTSVIHRG